MHFLIERQSTCCSMAVSWKKCKVISSTSPSDCTREDFWSIGRFHTSEDRYSCAILPTQSFKWLLATLSCETFQIDRVRSGCSTVLGWASAPFASGAWTPSLFNSDVWNNLIRLSTAWSERPKIISFRIHTAVLAWRSNWPEPVLLYQDCQLSLVNSLSRISETSLRRWPSGISLTTDICPSLLESSNTQKEKYAWC